MQYGLLAPELLDIRRLGHPDVRSKLRVITHCCKVYVFQFPLLVIFNFYSEGIRLPGIDSAGSANFC